MTTKQLLSASLHYLAPNQLRIELAGFVSFYSYESLIVTIDPEDQVYLGPDWKASKTTSKYRTQFLNESTKDTQEKLDNGTYKLIKENT